MDCLLHCQVLQINLPVFHCKLVVWTGQNRRSKQWKDEEEIAIEEELLTAHAQWVCLKIIINNFDCIFKKGCRTNNFLLKQQKLLKWQLIFKTTNMFFFTFLVAGNFIQCISPLLVFCSADCLKQVQELDRCICICVYPSALPK